MMVASKAAQGKVERATLDQLLKKPPRTATVEVTVDGGKATMLFRALGAKAYDDLLAEHPPTKKDKEDGGVWNGDTFPPALIAASSMDPKISVEEATEVWTSPDWSRGELYDMFSRLVRLNQEGLDIPFTQSD